MKAGQIFGPHFASLVTLLFLIALGAAFLLFAPTTVRDLRRSINDRPLNAILQGVIGLSMLLGMVPILAMTIVGLPLLPFIALAILIIWTLGYLLGGYAIAMRMWLAFGKSDDPSLIARLGALTAAVIVVALLNYIPFFGWFVNFTLVLLGVGAMANGVFLLILDGPEPALDVDMQDPLK